MATGGMVSLSELAREMGIDRSHVRKYAIQNGFMFSKTRTAKTRGMLTLSLSRKDADRLLKTRELQGFSSEGQDAGPCDEAGVFYIIQLVPDLAPNRVKFGFASILKNRLAQHRTAAPTCELLESWPSRRGWENTAIASVTSSGCKLIRNEVYECDDLSGLVARASKFFSFLPSPLFVIPLADTSPLINAAQNASSEEKV